MPSLFTKIRKIIKVTYANTDPSKTSLTRQAIKSTLKQTQVQELVQNLKKHSKQVLRPLRKRRKHRPKLLKLKGNPAQSGINSGIQAQAANNTGDKQTKVNTKQTKFDLSENYIYGDKDTTFFTKMTPILMGFFVFFFVFLISGMALLKERTTGTLDRLLATPVKRSDIVFGYMLSYSFIAALQTTVIVLSTIWLLDLDVLGSMGDVIVVNILFALVALSFGLCCPP